MSAETESIEQIVLRLHSLDAAVREAARQQILELPDEALLQLLAHYSRRSGRTVWRHGRRLIRALPYAAFAFAVAIALSKDPSADPRLKWALFVLGGCTATALVVIAGYGMRAMWRSGREMSGNPWASKPLPLPAIALLAGRTDGRFLPFLLSEIASHSSLFERAKAGTDMIPPSLPLAPAFSPVGVYRPVSPRDFIQFRRRYRKVLKAILAEMGPEADVDLSSDERDGLLLLLQTPEEDVELTLGILTRLERWGEAETVPVLKRLVREKHWYVGSDQVEAAARQSLERVEMRLRQEKQNIALLRPLGSEETVSPRSLLRPAADRPQHPPEQLLRPGISPPPDHPD